MEITNVIEWQDNISTPITAENLNKVNTGTKTAIDSLEEEKKGKIEKQSNILGDIETDIPSLSETVSSAKEQAIHSKELANSVLNKLSGKTIKVLPSLPSTRTSDTLYFVCPLFPPFSDATPAQIKDVFDLNMVPSNWRVGNVKTITLTDGTSCTLRLLDITRNRYEKSDGTGYSNCVIGFEEIITPSKSMRNENVNMGGWADSEIKNNDMSVIFNLLPREWQKVISTVKVASTVGDAQTTLSYSDNKLFLPAFVEVSDSVTAEGYKDEGTIFEYYKGTSSGSTTIRKKKYKNSGVSWWLRSPIIGSYSSFAGITTSGSESGFTASSSLGLSPVFAI